MVVLLPSFFAKKTCAQDSVEKPNRARAELHGKTFSLGNETIALEWQISDGAFGTADITNRLTGETLVASEAFAITILDGGVIKASEMTVAGAPEITELAVDASSSQRSLHFPGKQITLHLEDVDRRVSATWRGILRDGSEYVRQELTLQAKEKDVNITSVRLVDLQVSGAHVSGAVKGSPIIVGNLFFGFEHPLSESRATEARAVAAISRELPLRAGQSVTYSSVVGVTVPGQLRRAFLRYIERERAHPYRTFLHYNSWYDLGYFNKYDEAGAVNVVNAFGTELTQKRGTKLDSFLFDDGWDDDRTLWSFHSGFPHGFTAVAEAAAKYHTAPGVWLSPWGGYGEPHRQRVALGKQQGFETNEQGFMLSGPKYYARFRDTCLEMIRKYGVNQFKIDGTGNADQAFPGSAFDSDFAAAIHLIGELRAEKANLFINLTTGTYPSPFWLRYADSIWRGGDDHSFAGVGTFRQRWITYRDADTYSGIVQSGPLYPLNSLMLHGMIYAKQAKHLDTDPGGDFADEVHDYFGTGTQLQEMYITPALLSAENWDTLAEAANWSRANADVLVDTHWVGGDPAMLEVYGWASWSPRKGILTLRNPSGKPQSFSVDVQKIFELPAGSAQLYRAQSPWKKDAGQPAVDIQAGKVYTFHLQPFQVMNLDVLPRTEQ